MICLLILNQAHPWLLMSYVIYKMHYKIQRREPGSESLAAFYWSFEPTHETTYCITAAPWECANLADSSCHIQMPCGFFGLKK